MTLVQRIIDRRTDRAIAARSTSARPTVPLTIPMPLQEVVGNLTLDDEGVTAWFKLDTVRWSFQSNAQRHQTIRRAAGAWASLAGHRIHMRVTRRPHPLHEWARTLHNHPRTLAGVPADDPRRIAWSRDLIATQQHLKAYTSLAPTETYLGIEVGPRSALDKALTNLAGGRPIGLPREIGRLREALEEVTAKVAAPGLSGRPATYNELCWLTHRSTGLFIPGAPEQYLGSARHPEDMGSFTDHLQVEPIAGNLTLIRALPSPANTLTLPRGVVGEPAQEIDRFVAVLSIGRMEPLTIPESHHPILAFAQLFPFPVEISVHADIKTGKQAYRGVVNKLNLVRDQYAQYEDAEETDIPPQVEIVHREATRMLHEMTEGDARTASRVHGVYRLAVAGTTMQQVRDRIRQIANRYENDMRIEVAHPRGQVDLLGEFIPGSRASSSAHRRHLPISTFAATLPQIGAHVGDREGPYLGTTAGGVARAVCWEPWKATYDGESSGFVPIVGTLGAGKSALTGKIVYQNVTRGIPWTVLDPSGPLHRLTRIPAIAPYSQHVDLATAPAGALSPWAVIPDPHPENYPDTPAGIAQYESDRITATQQRKQLASDIVQMLLPPEVLTMDFTKPAIAEAMRNLPDHDASIAALADELARLTDFDRHGRLLSKYLYAMAEAPLARLMYGQSDRAPFNPDATLVVVTMGGLVLPNMAIDRSYWNENERLALPLFHLAAHVATSRIYGGSMQTPKGLALDETHFLSASPTGRALMQRVARDNRKWNCCVLAASQDPRDLLDQNIRNHIGGAFVGRLIDPDAQRDALTMLGVQTGVGYEEELATLSPPNTDDGRQRSYREFVFRDYTGACERVRVDIHDTAATRDGESDLAIALNSRQPLPAEWMTAGQAGVAA